MLHVNEVVGLSYAQVVCVLGEEGCSMNAHFCHRREVISHLDELKLIWPAHILINSPVHTSQVISVIVSL